MIQCRWCFKWFNPNANRRGGKQRHFCCPAHRLTFWQAARRYVLREVEAGRVAADPAKGEIATCTLPQRVHVGLGAAGTSGGKEAA
jgi:hypothetical protein